MKMNKIELIDRVNKIKMKKIELIDDMSELMSGE